MESNASLPPGLFAKNNEEVIKVYTEVIKRSREDFRSQQNQDIESAMKESLREMAEGGNAPGLEKVIQESLRTFENNETEEELLKKAMEESMKEREEAFNAPEGEGSEEEMLKKALQMSAADFGAPSSDFMSPAVQSAVEFGYSVEQAIEAISVVGDNPDMVLNYLLQLQFTPNSYY